MAFDDPKLPRAVLRGEELYVGDDKEPYFRDPHHVVALDVTDLRIAGGFEPANLTEARGLKVIVAAGLSGSATLEGRDKFAVAGLDIGKNTKIAFHLRTVAEEETRFLWAARVGYSMYDWDYDREAGFWVEGYCTQAEFDRIVSAVRAGRIERIRVALSTTMWTKKKSSGFMPGMPMTFHVAPPSDKESTTPALESGFIQSVTWDEAYVYRAPAPEPEPKPIVLPQLVYKFLAWILAAQAAVAVLLFLKW